MKIIKFFLFTICVGILGYGVYHSLFETEFTHIKEISIIGAQSETEARLHQKLKIPAESSFWKIDVNKIAETVKADAWVNDVEVNKVFPDKIVVKITERKPEAVINKGGNKFVYVDEEGILFGPAHAKDLGEHVILSGKSMNEDSKIRDQAIKLIKYFPQDGTLSKNEISEMQYAPEKGFELVLSKTGIKVELGKENIPLHIDRARRVVQYLDQHQINATHVDADYAKKVLVKVRKDR